MGYRPPPPRKWKSEAERNAALAQLVAEKPKAKRKREPVTVHGDDKHAELILREDEGEAMIFLPPLDAVEVANND